MTNRIVNFFINGFRAMKITNKQDLKNIYHGDVPLVYTYWFLPLYILPFDIALRYLDYVTVKTPNEEMSSVTIVATMVLFIIYVVLSTFSIIASWRSANKYQGRKLWKRLTKFSIVFAVCVLIIGFLINFATGVSVATKRQMLAYDTNQYVTTNISSDPSLKAT